MRSVMLQPGLYRLVNIICHSELHGDSDIPAELGERLKCVVQVTSYEIL